jgi:hypothetical protein
MKMKRLALILFILCMAGLLVACTRPKPTESSDLIRPGDTVGDFLVTTGEEGNFIYGFEGDCSEKVSEQKTLTTCELLVGEIINITTGIYDDTHSGKLDELWSNTNYQLFIEGRPVDLKAFGTVEYTHPIVGVIRFWNVVISTSKPGELNVNDSGVAGGDPFESTTTFTVNSP